MGDNKNSNINFYNNLQLDKNQCPQYYREIFRRNQISLPTPGLAPGYVQVNVVIMPEEYAENFREFCHKNSRACTLVDDFKGFYNSKLIDENNDLDLLSDIPLYRVWKNGELVSEQLDIRELCQQEYKDTEFHSFLIGCSFTFETAIMQEGIEIRHVQENKNVAMYKTNQDTVQVGEFKGPMVVSMRPFEQKDIQKVVEITESYPTMHGGPLHIGDPSFYGIEDISNPDFGDSVSIKEGETPLFWGCGVTSQMAVLGAKLPIAITHSPGYMLICDAKNTDFYVQQQQDQQIEEQMNQ